MEDDLSIMTTVEQSDNKGVIFVDEGYIGRLASIIDAEDSNRPGENTLFGSPYPEFPDQKKEIKRENNRGFIEEGGMLADKIANPVGELEDFTFYEGVCVKIITDVDVGSGRHLYVLTIYGVAPSFHRIIRLGFGSSWFPILFRLVILSFFSF